MKTNLEKYLHDHLAGANFAVELIRALCDKHKKDEVWAEMNAVRLEIEEDCEELVRIMVALGTQPGGIKETVAGLMEKLARPKLVNSPEDIFSSFEACETLALGILGKKELWIALSKTVACESKADFKSLEERAVRQYTVIENLRLHFAVRCLRSPG